MWCMKSTLGNKNYTNESTLKEDWILESSLMLKLQQSKMRANSIRNRLRNMKNLQTSSWKHLKKQKSQIWMNIL